jgi:hypothetical protein
MNTSNPIESPRQSSAATEWDGLKGRPEAAFVPASAPIVSRSRQEITDRNMISRIH